MNSSLTLPLNLHHNFDDQVNVSDHYPNTFSTNQIKMQHKIRLRKQGTKIKVLAPCLRNCGDLRTHIDSI